MQYSANGKGIFMRKIASLVLFSLAASCGGTSAPVVVNGVTGTAGNSLASAPTIAPVAVDTAADASFGALLNAVRAKEKPYRSKWVDAG